MIDRDELAAWLRILEAPRVGRESARRLLAAFGSPQGVLAASAASRREVAGPAAGEPLSGPSAAVADVLAKTLAWLQANPARRIVTVGDLHYPPALLETADPPLLLYVEGRIERLAAPAVAIVGSRHPTPQGLEHARSFGARLSRAGWAVVSGLALGIDAAAHQGALEGDGGTVAVVGTGLDQIYPLRHRQLAQRIADNGILVSEYSLGTPPLAENFPQRNRIIAGLAKATLVVEAAPRSGSLITARLANEAGRDVLAIPGSILSPQSRGCHALIKQGAKLVESVDDVLDELCPPTLGGDRSGAASRPRLVDAAPRVAPSEPSPDSLSDPLLAALGFDPLTLDALAERTGWAPAALSTRLLQLELEGRVARLPGQRFQRLVSA